MMGKVVQMGFEIISKLDSFFLITVNCNFWTKITKKTHSTTAVQWCKARIFLKTIQLLGRPWICQSIFNTAVRSVVVTIPLPPARCAVCRRRAALLYVWQPWKTCWKTDLLFFFPWICSNSFNISTMLIYEYGIPDLQAVLALWQCTCTRWWL